MRLKTVLITLFLLFSTQYLNAKAESRADFLLKADDTTSFMHYEFHNLAMEAAKQKNYEDAFRIYLKIAEKGDDRAEYNVGMMYMNGLGVKKGKMDAYKWLRRASKHGNKEATLFFKEMNDRYEQKHLEKQAQKAKKTVKEKEESDANKTAEKNTTEIALAKVAKPVNKTTKPAMKKESDSSTPIFYIAIASIGIIIVLGLFFMLRSSRKAKETNTPQSNLKYKAQMYDITYAHISKYHTELLKFFNIDKYKNDKKQMQKYYMFIGGMIDYFCKLEKFSDMEERRIFTTHMSNIEGKENVTAITQAILEGQRDTSLYHCQAAGVVSAKEWHKTGSTNAFLKLKQVLAGTRD